jgi:macrolide transport system ATP-binding/permease protein
VIRHTAEAHFAGRLKPGVSYRRAEAELGVLAPQVGEDYPGWQTIELVNSAAYLNSPEARAPGAWVAAAILALAGFVLAITCINEMNLLLARATTRYQEIGIRLALGVSRMRLIRQLLTKTILLALLDGAASVVVAKWLPPLLVHAVPEMPMSTHLDLSPNFAILTSAFLAPLVAAALCGFAPALHAARLDVLRLSKKKGLLCRAGWGARVYVTR